MGDYIYVLIQKKTLTAQAPPHLFLLQSFFRQPSWSALAFLPLLPPPLRHLRHLGLPLHHLRIRHPPHLHLLWQLLLSLLDI